MSSRMQADDFFNAYQVLSENDKAAIRKLEKLAGKPLESTISYGSLPTIGVTIVCLAFSVELYIKDIYFALNMAPPRGHNILKLYEGLPGHVQQEIFAHKAISQNPFATRGDIFSPRIFSSAYTAYDRFIDEIKAISNGFEKWRYSYESVSLNYNEGFALAFINSIKSVADVSRSHPQSRAL